MVCEETLLELGLPRDLRGLTIWNVDRIRSMEELTIMPARSSHFMMRTSTNLGRLVSYKLQLQTVTARETPSYSNETVLASEL